MSRRGTNTVVARDISAETAKQAYFSNRRKVEKTMRDLMEEIKRMDSEYAKDESNWGYAGSMGHVLELLVEAKTFLGPS